MKRLAIPDGWRFPIFVVVAVVIFGVIYGIQTGWF